MIFIFNFFKYNDSVDVNSKSAELAFYLLLSVFPFLMFIINCIAYIPYIHMYKFIDIIKTLLPFEIYNIVTSLISSTIKDKSIYNLVLSFILALWSSSRAVISIIKIMNRYYNIEETRSYFKILTICFLFTIVLFALIFSTLTLLIYGEIIGKFVFTFIGFNNIFMFLWNYFRFFVGVITVINTFLILFMYTPNKKVTLIECFPGAIISTISWIIISLFYSYYVSNFASYEIIYGSISSMIILITWLYLSSFSIILGCRINSKLYFVK